MILGQMYGETKLYRNALVRRKDFLPRTVILKKINSETQLSFIHMYVHMTFFFGLPALKVAFKIENVAKFS